MSTKSENPGSGPAKITQNQLDAMARLHERFLEGRLGGRRADLKNTDLSGLSLKSHKLRQASFVGCVMTHMDLSACDFQEASLYACDLSFSNLNKAIFVRADLRGARIENATLEGADLEKADLRMGGLAGNNNFDGGQAVNFRGANLSGAKLAGSMASRADFSDAILSGANIARADLRGAQMEGADLSGADVDGAQFHGANMKAAILTGIESKQLAQAEIDVSSAITDENVGKAVNELEIPLPKLIDEHRLWVQSAGGQGKQLDLSRIDMRALKSLKMEKLTAIRALHAKFFGMNLYKIELQSAVMDHADLRNCDMEEADLRGTSFKDANLAHAKLKNANCSSLLFGEGSGTRRFSPCNFEGAKFRYADLSGLKAKGSIFKNTDLSYADLSGADLRDADFTGAILNRTNLDGAQTEGAKFDREDGVFKLKE